MTSQSKAGQSEAKFLKCLATHYIIVVPEK
jgi:hypothetical protein